MQERNIIERLKETLKFYAEPANYRNNQITLDDGHQARFALDQVKSLTDQLDKFQSDYEIYQNKINEGTADEIQKAIDDLKNIK